MIVDAKPVYKHKFYDVLLAIVSALVSAFVAGYSFYLSGLGNNWFICIFIHQR